MQKTHSLMCMEKTLCENTHQSGDGRESTFLSASGIRIEQNRTNQSTHMADRRRTEREMTPDDGCGGF